MKWTDEASQDIDAVLWARSFDQVAAQAPTFRNGRAMASYIFNAWFSIVSSFCVTLSLEKEQASKGTKKMWKRGYVDRLTQL